MRKHEEVRGVVSMHPGITKGATCTCGWHSHTRTFEQHLELVAEEETDE